LIKAVGGADDPVSAARAFVLGLKGALGPDAKG